MNNKIEKYDANGYEPYPCEFKGCKNRAEFRILRSVGVSLFCKKHLNQQEQK